jgi:hypothetical protein
MVVRGVRVVAPDGECVDSEGFSEPCNTRLLSTYIYVSNYSIADIEDFNDLQFNTTELVAAGIPAAEVESLRQLSLWGTVASNATEGFCNMVLDFDLFGDDSVDGEMVNNGTLNIGCGLGLLSGNTSFTIPGLPGSDIPGVPAAPTTIEGSGGGAIKQNPVGTWVFLTRPSLNEELALCGFEVCAKPLDGAAAPAPAAAAPTTAP